MMEGVVATMDQTRVRVSQDATHPPQPGPQGETRERSQEQPPKEDSTQGSMSGEQEVVTTE